LIYSEIGNEVLRAIGIVGIIILIGIVLAIIGLQHEYIIKLRTMKKELETELNEKTTEIKDLKKKLKNSEEDIKDLERELSYYERK